MREINRTYDFPDIIDGSDCTFNNLRAILDDQDGGGIQIVLDVSGTRENVAAALRKLADSMIEK